MSAIISMGSSLFKILLHVHVRTDSWQCKIDKNQIPADWVDFEKISVSESETRPNQTKCNVSYSCYCTEDN